MPTIVVEHLTCDYGHGRGVFDVSLEVEQGMCFGFLGPNGAGKTTTIRHLMGFSKPQKGKTSIDGKDSWTCSAELQNVVGYLPGEVTLPTNITGTAFLNMMQNMRGPDRPDRRAELLERFALDTDIPIKQMSLGVKRKLAVVTAFMQDPAILILDEPTSGLDPVMQEEFIVFLKEEIGRGKTIFLSSHIFHEVDATCQRIAIIREGHVVSEFDAAELKDVKDRIYQITFGDDASMHTFLQGSYNVTSQSRQQRHVRVQLPKPQTAQLTRDLSRLDVTDFTEIPFTLEDYFMSFYDVDHKLEAR